MESLTPNLFVRDINSSISFYQQLGFELIMTVPETGNYDWAMLTCNKVTVMLQTFKSLGDELPEISRKHGAPLLLYIKINDIRKFFERIEDKVAVLKGLEKTFYGATEFSVLDPEGYVLTFAEDEG